MPIIRVEMLEGRSLVEKRELVATFTRELSRICNCSEASITVVIDDIAKQNWGTAGVLLADEVPDSTC